MFLDLLRVQLILKGVMTDEDWYELKKDINFVFNTDNYFWDLKESEILAERMKMLSFIEPYVGKYFSTEYVKSKILKQTEEEIKEIGSQMETDKQRIQAEQAAILAQQQAQQQAQQGQAPEEEQK
jgi:hypothetical protein